MNRGRTRGSNSAQLQGNHLNRDFYTRRIRWRLTQPDVAQEWVRTGIEEVIFRIITPSWRWIKGQEDERLGLPAILDHPASGDSLCSAAAERRRFGSLTRDFPARHTAGGSVELVDRCLKRVLVKGRRQWIAPFGGDKTRQHEQATTGRNQSPNNPANRGTRN